MESIKKYKKSNSKIEKTQLIYIFQEFFISVTIAIFINLILGSFMLLPIGISRIGIYSVIVFIILTAIAISKYELFNVKFILTEILVSAIALVLLYQAIVSPTIQWRILDGIILSFFVF